MRVDADDAREAEAVHVEVDDVDEDERAARVGAPADEEGRRCVQFHHVCG